MKTYLIHFSLLLSSLFVTSCIIINDDDDGPDFCIEGVRNEVLREYNLPRIEGIHSFVEADIFITQGDRQIIEVEGPPNILDLLEFEISNGVWDITTRRCYRNAALRFFITLEDFEYLGFSGSSNITSTNTLFTNDLEIDVFGSGDVDIEIDADDVDVNMIGSGDVDLYGDGDDLFVVNSGSGNLGTFSYRCNTADIRVFGSGNTEFPVVNAAIVGSGVVIDAN